MNHLPPRAVRPTIESMSLESPSRRIISEPVKRRFPCRRRRPSPSRARNPAIRLVSRSPRSGRERPAAGAGSCLWPADLDGGRARRCRAARGPAPPACAVAAGRRLARGQLRAGPWAPGPGPGLRLRPPRVASLRSSARRVLACRREIPGIAEASGAIEIHEDGFRAERARPYAFLLPPGATPVSCAGWPRRTARRSSRSTAPTPCWPSVGRAGSGSMSPSWRSCWDR